MSGCVRSLAVRRGLPSPILPQVAQLRAALDNERHYDVPPEHDPSLLLLEGTHQLGVSTLFTEPIVYMMATEVCVSYSIVCHTPLCAILHRVSYSIVCVCARVCTCEY